MFETMNKGTCFCRCLFLVEMRAPRSAAVTAFLSH